MSAIETVKIGRDANIGPQYVQVCVGAALMVFFGVPEFAATSAQTHLLVWASSAEHSQAPRFLKFASSISGRELEESFSNRVDLL
jgi:hypothetical protein